MARFDRLGDGSDAEAAFVVADSWQGRGLGRVLFDHFADRAREVGVTRFVAETLFHNRRMLAMFHHAGLPLTERVDGSVVHVTIDLGENVPPAQDAPTNG